MAFWGNTVVYEDTNSICLIRLCTSTVTVSVQVILTEEDTYTETFLKPGIDFRIQQSFNVSPVALRSQFDSASVH